MEIYEVQLVVRNRYGEFVGEPATVDKLQYDELLKMSKNFYAAGGFELTCNDDSYVIFPPDIVAESVLIIKIISRKNV